MSVYVKTVGVITFAQNVDATTKHKYMPEKLTLAERDRILQKADELFPDRKEKPPLDIQLFRLFQTIIRKK